MDIAFGEERSKDLIPDKMIAFWHPDSRKQDPKVIGKQDHIKQLIENSGQKIPMKSIALFDDDESNCKVAGKKGVQVFFCKAVPAKDKVSLTGFNSNVWANFVSAKGKGSGGCIVM